MVQMKRLQDNDPAKFNFEDKVTFECYLIQSYFWNVSWTYWRRIGLDIEYWIELVMSSCDRSEITVKGNRYWRSRLIMNCLLVNELVNNRVVTQRGIKYCF